MVSRQTFLYIFVRSRSENKKKKKFRAKRRDLFTQLSAKKVTTVGYIDISFFLPYVFTTNRDYQADFFSWCFIYFFFLSPYCDIVRIKNSFALVENN